MNACKTMWLLHRKHLSDQACIQVQISLNYQRASRCRHILKQECIPVGCVLPACCPYLPAWTAPGGSAPGGICCQGLRGVCLLPGGFLLPGGVCFPGGASQHGLRQTPSVKRITDTCKNITLPELRCWR